MSEETTKPKAKPSGKVRFNVFLGMISIDGNNKFAAERLFANNSDEKTPKQWNTELAKIKGLTYTYNI